MRSEYKFARSRLCGVIVKVNLQKAYVICKRHRMKTLVRLFSGLFSAKVERRQTPRYILKIPFTLKDQSGQTYLGLTCDMGGGGIGGTVTAELAIGDEVLVTYQLPDGSPPQTHRAKLSNKNGDRYGFEFVEDSRAMSGNSR